MKHVGSNVQYTVQGDKLIIEVDLSQRGTPSKSGKTLVIASTQGNKRLVNEDGNEIITLGLNAYRPR